MRVYSGGHGQRQGMYSHLPVEENVPFTATYQVAEYARRLQYAGRIKSGTG